MSWNSDILNVSVLKIIEMLEHIQQIFDRTE